MKFIASIHKVSFDKDGEGTVVLKTPLSDLLKVVPLLGLIEQELEVKITNKGEEE